MSEITKQDIQINQCYIDGSAQILINKIIGNYSKRSGKDIYQLATSSDEKENCDEYESTTTQGIIFAKFYTLEKFLEFYNKKLKENLNEIRNVR